MKRLESLEDIFALEYGDKIHVIERGDNESLIYAGQHPKMQAAIFIKNHSHLTAVVFTKSNILSKIILSGKYDSKVVGQAMIEQLNNSIKSIEKIYCSPTI